MYGGISFAQACPRWRRFSFAIEL